jgi:hypothetical protein
LNELLILKVETESSVSVGGDGDGNSINWNGIFCVCCCLVTIRVVDQSERRRSSYKHFEEISIDFSYDISNNNNL